MKTFESLVAEFVNQTATDGPAEASLRGLTEWDHELEDLSEEAIEARHARDKHWLQTFQSLDTTGLSDRQTIDRELIVAQLGARVANFDFDAWRRSPEQYLGNGVFYLFIHGTRPQAEAVAAAIDRLAQVPRNLNAAKKNLRADLASPDILNRELTTIRGQATFLRHELGSLVDDAALSQQLLAAAEPAAAAYDDLAEFVEQLAAKATGTFVFGEQRYNTVLQQAEQLTYDLRELREIGAREFAAIEQQIAEVAARLSGSKDWREVVSDLQAKHAQDLPGLLEEYRELTARARQFVIDHDLITLPEGEWCVVEPAPSFYRTIAVPSYFPAAAFGPLTHGTFNIPYTPDGATNDQIEERLRSNASWENVSVTAHEAYPGHHAHFARMTVASPVRQFLTSNFFVEGWALYTEKLMYDHGFYEDDAEILGYLAGRLLRAGRIIVDTGLHSGEMSLEAAHDFIRDRIGLPDSVAKAEALRYAAWPTQASGYLAGALAIEKMAKEWTDSGRGTLTQFHDAITATGALPLGLAAQAIGLTDVALTGSPAGSGQQS
jgi:uncharacterized protein (DUF885 family)